MNSHMKVTPVTIFDTPGLIPVESFTTFGINSKPNEQNPIGFFGTGLKYAVAVILRHKLKLRVFIGNVEYEFYASTEEFRGKDFQFIKMRKRSGLLSKWHHTKLPFTLELGKTWKLWQAFRELESNTRDEHGTTFCHVLSGTLDDHDKSLHQMVSKERTLIVVEGDAFAEEFNKQDEIFLPKEKLTHRFTIGGIEVYNQPARYVYFRGLRVYELPEGKPSMYTYNLTGYQELTEDRTLKYPFLLKSELAELVAKCEDKGFIHSITQAKDKHFEGTLDFEYVSSTPSPVFLSTISSRRSSALYVAPRIGSYYDRYAIETPPTPKPAVDAPLLDKWEWWLQSDNIKDEELKSLIRQTIQYLKGDFDAEEVVEEQPDYSVNTKFGIDDEIPF